MASIHFYEPEDNFGFLSNFYCAGFVFEGEYWPTSEHCYQAQKFHSPAIKLKVRQAPSARHAFELSRQYQDRVRREWLDVRCEVMEQVVKQKFIQNPSLAFRLCGTLGKTLIEHSPVDGFWGDAGEQGRNELGKILMRIRGELAERAPYNLLQYVETCHLPTPWGQFELHGFMESATGKEHLALSMGQCDLSTGCNLSVHSACVAGDRLGAMSCMCRQELAFSMQVIAKATNGVIFYLASHRKGRDVSPFLGGRSWCHGKQRLSADEQALALALCQFFGVKQARVIQGDIEALSLLKTSGIGLSRATHFGVAPRNTHLNDLGLIPDY